MYHIKINEAHNINELYSMNYTLWKDKLPESGKNIIIIDTDDERHYGVFRCGHTPNCQEVRSIFGGALLVVPEKWIYDPDGDAEYEPLPDTWFFDCLL